MTRIQARKQAEEFLHRCANVEGQLPVRVKRVVRPLVYLATPYSHPEPAVRQSRFEAANRAAAKLMNSGVKIFSPISHTHPIAEAGQLPLGWAYWQEYDRAILKCCHKIIVLKLAGWEQSKGVKGELDIAKELGLEIEYIEEV